MSESDLPLGAHQSIAGGTPRAVERGIDAGCRVLQIFVKNNNRWIGKPIEHPEAREFRTAARAARFSRVIAHTSYLINLASPDIALRRKSIESLAEEIDRCARLGQCAALSRQPHSGIVLRRPASCADVRHLRRHLQSRFAST